MPLAHSHTTYMEKYRRVVDQDSASALLPQGQHIVRVNVSGKLTNYIAYAQKLLRPPAGDEVSEVVGKVELVALGRAINRAVTVAEILRRNHPGLHQCVQLRSLNMMDTYEPLEEGLSVLNMKRHMSALSITLSKSPDSMDTEAPGYAPPLDPELHPAIPDDTVLEMDRGRGRKAKANSNGNGNGNINTNGGNANGGGRGRGRRPRNRKRRTRKDNDNSKSNGNANMDIPAAAPAQIPPATTSLPPSKEEESQG